ncbi:hypothetical protein [Streptomyces xanthochromogenes]
MRRPEEDRAGARRGPLSDEKARRTAAGHPALPAQAFAELLGDGDWQVVEAAAANPSLPAAVMAQLLPRT